MKMLKQYNLPYTGNMQHVIYQTLPMFSVVSNIFTAITMYGVWRTGIMSYMPWMSLPFFLLVLAILVVTAVFINYKFLYQSYFTFQNQQQFPVNSPLIRQIRLMIREEITNGQKCPHCGRSLNEKETSD